MTSQEPLTIPSAIADVGRQYGLDNFEPLKGGETGALLYTCIGTDGSARVLKLAVDDISAEEVDNNVSGYEALRSIGAEDLLPQGIVSDTHKGEPFIIMPYLGRDFMSDAKAGRIDLYPTFLNAMRVVTAATLREDADAHTQGLAEFRDQIVRWYDVLEHKGRVTREDVADLETLDLADLASDRTSLMLLDFTGDNVFVGDSRVTFIDPWRQGTYLGSIIPSMAQFQTLLEVLDIPGSKEYAPAFNKCIAELGEQLALTPEQIRKQKLLGACLQYALSGFVRIDSEPERSAALIESSKQAMKGIIQAEYVKHLLNDSSL